MSQIKSSLDLTHSIVSHFLENFVFNSQYTLMPAWLAGAGDGLNVKSVFACFVALQMMRS